MWRKREDRGWSGSALAFPGFLLLLVAFVAISCSTPLAPATPSPSSIAPVAPSNNPAASASAPVDTGSPAASADAASSPSPTPDRAARAQAACAALLDNIPLVIVNSGTPTVAAAYEVTGAQLTRYFVMTLNANPNFSNGSDWWNQPTKLVDMCLFDGDLSTMTPIPTGSSDASRVLVVISNGDAEFWAQTMQNEFLPAVDPAALLEPTPHPTMPIASGCDTALPSTAGVPPSPTVRPSFPIPSRGC